MPSPTRIDQEQLISDPSPNSYKVLAKKLKEKFDNDVDLNAFTNEIPDIFCTTLQINITRPVTKSSSSRQILITQQPDQSPQPPPKARVARVIKLTFIRNIDNTS